MARVLKWADLVGAGGGADEGGKQVRREEEEEEEVFRAAGQKALTCRAFGIGSEWS